MIDFQVVNTGIFLGKALLSSIKNYIKKKMMTYGLVNSA